MALYLAVDMAEVTILRLLLISNFEKKNLNFGKPKATKMEIKVKVIINSGKVNPLLLCII
jgi:hypothetical protein